MPGTGWGAPFGQFPEKGWDKVMDVNAKSPFFLIQALAPLLKKNASADNTASIINIGSIAGIVGNALDNFSYAASKDRHPSAHPCTFDRTRQRSYSR